MEERVFAAVKLTFAKEAALKDPSVLFHSSLDGNARRAIGIHEGDKVDEAALQPLVRAAAAFHLAGKSNPKTRQGSRKRAGSFLAGSRLFTDSTPRVTQKRNPKRRTFS